MSPDLKYFFQFDGNSDRSTVVFLDYFATDDVGRNLFGIEENRLGIKLGKWKVPCSSSRRDLLPDDAGWLFRTQFQLAF